MRTLTSEDTDLSFIFDKLGENPFGEVGNNIWKQILTINHDYATNKGKIKVQLALEQNFGFCLFQDI